MNLGIAEGWTLRLADSEAHLEEGLALGRAAGRPYVEVGCLGALGVVAYMTHHLDLAEDRLRQAIAVADRVGWSTDRVVGPSYSTLGAVLIDRGHLTEGEAWLERADPILTDSPEPAASVGLRHAQGMLAFCRGRFADALDAFRDGERLADQLRAPHFLAAVERQWQLRAALALGDPEPARAALADAGGAATAAAAWCNLAARLRLAAGDATGAAAAVAPVLDGRAFVLHVNQEIEALLLDGLARRRLAEPEAAERSTERALELAEPQGRVWIVLTVPGVRELLEAHPLHRTAHAAHLRALLDHVAGVEPSHPTREAEELTSR